MGARFERHCGWPLLRRRAASGPGPNLHFSLKVKNFRRTNEKPPASLKANWGLEQGDSSGTL